MKVLIGTTDRWIRGLLAVLAVFITGCNAVFGTATSEQAQDEGQGEKTGRWQTIATGIEWQETTLGGGGLLSREMTLLRLDPQAIDIRVHYTPGEARSLAEWGQQLPGAAVIVNGAFFDENNRALGLIVADGQVFGQTFAGFGGMLEVTSQTTRVRSLVAEPYAGEPLWQAVQSFPMLIERGGVMAPRGSGFDAISRRTWVAHDQHGRILFGVTHALISLADLQNWLLESDLGIDVAFALDGGRSSGLVIATGEKQDSLPTLDAIPSVIAVYPR